MSMTKYDNRMVPSLIVYFEKKVKKHFQGLSEFGGVKLNEDCIFLTLKQVLNGYSHKMVFWKLI